MEKSALVIVEHKDGKPLPASWEAVECARRLCGGMEKVRAIVMARDAEVLGRDLGLAIPEVLAVSGTHLEPYNGELFLQSILGEIQRERPGYVIMAHTPLGMDLGPCLAVKARAGYVPGVEDVRPEDNVFIRPIHNGKFCQEVVPTTDMVVCSVLPGSFSWDPSQGKPGNVNSQTLDQSPEKIRFVRFEEDEGPDLSMAQADVIICAGRGMGGPENMELIQQAAELFPRAAVAGSRIACDMGWLSYKQQIGVTGQTVAPKLYVGCGVSGAFQHVAGMRGAHLVVAVNTDPKAPIFSIADYCIVEDAMAFLPALIEAAQSGEGQ